MSKELLYSLAFIVFALCLSTILNVYDDHKNNLDPVEMVR